MRLLLFCLCFVFACSNSQSKESLAANFDSNDPKSVLQAFVKALQASSIDGLIAVFPQPEDSPQESRKLKAGDIKAKFKEMAETVLRETPRIKKLNSIGDAQLLRGANTKTKSKGIELYLYPLSIETETGPQTLPVTVAKIGSNYRVVIARKSPVTKTVNQNARKPQQVVDLASAREAVKDGKVDVTKVKNLDAATARVLASLKNPFAGLRFNSLEKLDVAAAVELAKWKGKILFIKLSTLSDEVARALSGSKANQLHISVPSIGVSEATSLSAYAGESLAIQGVTTIDLETAVALATSRASDLTLGQLTNLKPEVAAALAKYKGELWYPSMK